MIRNTFRCPGTPLGYFSKRIHGATTTLHDRFLHDNLGHALYQDFSIFYIAFVYFHLDDFGELIGFFCFTSRLGFATDFVPITSISITTD